MVCIIFDALNRAKAIIFWLQNSPVSMPGLVLTAQSTLFFKRKQELGLAQKVQPLFLKIIL